MDPAKNLVYSMTVEEVYGARLNELKVPHGYELTGEFRSPSSEDTWLGSSNIIMHGRSSFSLPRLILKKIETISDVYGAGWSMQGLMDEARKHGYELTGEFRVPLRSEWFLTARYEIGAAANDFSDGKRLIAKSFEQTIIEIYGKGRGSIKPPEGYEFNGKFRPPTEDDVWLGLDRADVFHGRHSEPRLILEKVPPTPTIESVYGSKNVPIPSGWKFKEFREIKAWEKLYYLSCNGVVLYQYLSCEDLYFHDILESKVPFYRIVIEPDLSSFAHKTTVSDVYGSIPKVPEGYTVADFRIPKEGEPFLRTNEKVGYCPAFYSCEGPRLILRKD